MAYCVAEVDDGFIFIWFGIQKFSRYAADSIAPLISHSPFMSWLGVFGVPAEAKVSGLRTRDMMMRRRAKHPLRPPSKPTAQR